MKKILNDLKLIKVFLGYLMKRRNSQIAVIWIIFRTCLTEGITKNPYKQSFQLLSYFHFKKDQIVQIQKITLKLVIVLQLHFQPQKDILKYQLCRFCFVVATNFLFLMIPLQQIKIKLSIVELISHARSNKQKQFIMKNLKQENRNIQQIFHHKIVQTEYGMNFKIKSPELSIIICYSPLLLQVPIAQFQCTQQILY
ncbi:unnamed protein product [Paramecium primaurelia]|uniref:Uncharacterized protein n=1 Tax=Paramecium primaurelia TaxID=5886 RepID=A0A8S1PK41_PARPR|nr:unnamed protein product [Paramecium primaurelia]